MRGPRLADHVCVVALDYDLASLLQSIAAGVEPVTAPCFYATRADGAQKVQLHRISAFLATVLGPACKGQPEGIAACLRQEFGLEDTYDVSTLAEELLRQLCRDGWMRSADLTR